MMFFIKVDSYAAFFPLSGKSSSITVTAPPVASWMRRASCGDGRRILQAKRFI